MGQEGRRVVELKFTVHHMSRRLSQLYGDLLQKRGLIPVSDAGAAFPPARRRPSFSRL
jgi:hypothetical protein